MLKKKLNTGAILLSGIMLMCTNVFSQDPNFYIYLCFGQSNMQGAGTIEEQDKTVDNRFRVLQAVDCSNLGRTKGEWYAAVPPLCRCWNGLSPADYFGRTMVANLPDSIRVGVINVSVAGCKIELFDKDHYQDYVSTVTADWLISIINAYDGNPYEYLVGLAKMAQQDGVIKGILLHQGESNGGDTGWPSKVKLVYDNLIADLGLDADSVPLLAGELVNADQGGAVAPMNSIIALLPDFIPNSYVISSSGCSAGSDNLHFNSAGYRKFGARYAIQMLSLMGIEVKEPEPEPPDPEGSESVFLEAECAGTGKDWDVIEDPDASNGYYIMVEPGLESLSEAADSNGEISLPFTVSSDTTYYVYGLLNCPNSDDDSYWLKMDDGEFVMINGLVTNGWQWMTLNNYELTAGGHTLTITYREDGAGLDKICISDFSLVPEEKGEEAVNICEPNIDTSNVDTSTAGFELLESTDGFILGQNCPNPFSKHTRISFRIPYNTFVSLKVYNVLGIEIAELAGRAFDQGMHTLEFEPGKLPEGQYIYRIKTDRFSETRIMFKLAE